MNNEEHKERVKIQLTPEAIAEQWVNLVMAHIQAKKFANKQPIKINKKHEYTN